MTVYLMISLQKVPHIHRIYGSGQPYVRYRPTPSLGEWWPAQGVWLDLCMTWPVCGLCVWPVCDLCVTCVWLDLLQGVWLDLCMTCVCDLCVWPGCDLCVPQPAPGCVTCLWANKSLEGPVVGCVCVFVCVCVCVFMCVCVILSSNDWKVRCLCW